MSNKLKILVTLSIFAFILTGYFYFFSSSIKNQPITHNDNNGEVTNIKSENIESKDKDKNNKKGEISSKKSTLKIILFVIILIIIIGVVVVIVKNRNKTKNEIKSKEENIFNKKNKTNELKFTEESKEDIIKNKLENSKVNENETNELKSNPEPEKDFTKAIFCPTFFLISVMSIQDEKIDNIEENGESFFKILVNFIFSKYEARIKKIKKIKISLSFDNVNDVIDENPDGNTLTISFSNIVGIISNFAFCNNYHSPEVIKNAIKTELPNFAEQITNNIENYWKKNEDLQKKYDINFGDFLYSYLLYYFLETLRNSIWKDKEIEVACDPNLKEKKGCFKKNNNFYAKEGYIENIYLNCKVNFDFTKIFLKEMIEKSPQLSELTTIIF